MKIDFCLDWISRSSFKSSSFKRSEYYSLCLEYKKRIAFFTPIEIVGAKRRPKESGDRQWLCDSRGKTLSSEQIAEKLDAVKLANPPRLIVGIGAADGYSKEDLDSADLVWSFGPPTFVHELAAVMALEQLYRANCILAGHPYHSGH